MFVRKHLIALLRSSPTVRAAFRHLPLRVWRPWIPDQDGVCANIPDCFTAFDLQVLLGGVPAELAACWGCLLLPVRKMDAEAQTLWQDPQYRPVMILAAAEYRRLYGVAPTPQLLTQLVLRHRRLAPPPPARRRARPKAAAAAPTDLGGTAEPAEPGDAVPVAATDAVVALPTRACECTGNCDTKCPARRPTRHGRGSKCPNPASVNLAIRRMQITAMYYRGRRPLCQHYACQHDGCGWARRLSPYCGTHRREHPGAERLPWTSVGRDGRRA